MKSKITQILQRIRQLRRKTKLLLAVVIASVLIIGVTAVVINRSNDMPVLTSTTSEDQLRNQAENFVGIFGTYTAEDYPAYVEALRSAITEEYYQKTFTPEVIEHKQKDIQGIVETTVPDEFNKGTVKIDGESAQVSLNARETTTINGEDYSDSVDYTISYTRQDGNWIVNDVKIERPF